MYMFNKSSLRLLAFITLSSSSLQLSAAPQPAFSEEEDIFGSIPVTHTATRLSQSVHDSPVSITIIDREMIEAYDGYELVDVLRLVPGFQVTHPRGFRNATSYHGLGSEYSSRMQVQIDGRSVYTPILGHVEWAELPIEAEDIERIEVIRGPNAASYGANSFTAIINIITNHASETPGLYLKASNGDRNLKRYVARYGGNTGLLDYRVTASYRSDSGFADPNFPDDKELGSFNFRGDYQPTLDNNFEFQVGYRDSKHQDGDIHDPRSERTDPKRDVDGRTHYQLFRWRHQVDEKEHFSLQFYHNYQRIDDTYLTAPLDTINPISDDDAAALGVSGFTELLGLSAGTTAVNQPIRLSFSRLTHRYDLEFQHNLEVNDDLRLVWGASARYEQTGGDGFFNTTSSHDFNTNHTYRLFGHGEWKPNPKWTINAGTMIENNDITGTDISPRLAINHHITPNHSIRASVSRAYRTPTVLETRSDFVAAIFDTDGNRVEFDQTTIGDPDLEPEKLTSLELAYTGHFPKYGLNLDAKLFYDKIDNLINDVENEQFTDPGTALLNPFLNSLSPGLGDSEVALNSDEVNFYANVGDARLKGFEAQLQWQINNDTRLHAGYTILDVSGTALDEINDRDTGESSFDDLSEQAPKSISTLQLIHDLQHDIRTSLAFHHYSQYNFEGGDETGPFSILNARVAKTFRLGNSQARVAVSFQNLLDDYFDYEAEQVFEKRLFLTFEYGVN